MDVLKKLCVAAKDWPCALNSVIQIDVFGNLIVHQVSHHRINATQPAYHTHT